jgi:hypothetical protein
MRCPYAEFVMDGVYECALDGGSCDDPEWICDSAKDFIDDEEDPE